MSWIYQDVEAGNCAMPGCKACVSKVVSGKLRLEQGNDECEQRKKCVKKPIGKNLSMPLCVLDVGRKKLLVHIPEDVPIPDHDDKLPAGDWWIKSRYVLESDVESKLKIDDIDCSTVVAYTMLGTPDSMGATRGSGEDPCK